MNEYRSTEIKDLIAALVLAQVDFNQPAKSKTVKSGQYSWDYSTVDDLIKAVRGALKKNNLAFDCHVEAQENGSHIFVAEISHTSGQWKASRIKMVPEKNTIQGFGGCITYLTRYCMSMMLGIAGIEEMDDDGVSQGESKFEVIKNTITDAQVKIIDELIGPDDTIYDAFLKSAKIKDLKELKAEHFNAAVEWINKQKPQCAKAVKSS